MEESLEEGLLDSDLYSYWVQVYMTHTGHTPGMLRK
jgi:hypothetical protein